MLGRDTVDQRQSGLEIGHQDHRPNSFPAGAGDLGPGQGGEMDNDRRADLVRRKSSSSVIRIDCAAVSCSAWLKRSAAIQAGSLAPSATTRISEGPAIMSSADRAEYLALGGGDIGIAGADDLVHGSDRLGAVSQGGDGWAPPMR